MPISCTWASTSTGTRSPLMRSSTSGTVTYSSRGGVDSLSLTKVNSMGCVSPTMKPIGFKSSSLTALQEPPGRAVVADVRTDDTAQDGQERPIHHIVGQPDLPIDGVQRRVVHGWPAVARLQQAQDGLKRLDWAKAAGQI